MQFITYWDFLLLPFYLVVIYFVARQVRERFYPPGHPWRTYFMQGLTVKLAGALFISLIYVYYYGGGDTLNYFAQSTVVNKAISDPSVSWFRLAFRLAEYWEGDYFNYTTQLHWYHTPNTYMVITIASVINLVTFNTFLPTALLFGAFSFTGIWALFRTFAGQYPKLVKHIALAVLFVPSTFIWGSGIFKDTVCMFGLGWMTYGAFQMLLKREFAPGTIILAAFGFYLVALIKIYILLAFLPALALWILLSYSHKIQSSFVRIALKFGVAGLAAGGFLLFSDKFAEELGQYSLENIAKTSTVTRDWIVYSSGDQGSVYNLGTLDPSFQGMLKKFPQAVNVTLFRPYLWEARKPIVFLNALEAFLFLFITVKILFTIGPRKVWSAFNSDPNIQFCIIFTLIFAFAVGISSGNFGALSRYRIPCLPMYALALMLIYYKYNPPEKKFLSLK